MISNQGLIRDNVLKRTLREQITKVTHVMNYTPVVSDRINQLTQQISIQQNVLQQFKERHFLRQQQIARQKQSLKQQLRAKMFMKMTEQQGLSCQMKILQQNCHTIRENRLKLSEIKSKTNRISNELEELQINQKEAQEEIEKLELKQIYDKKVLNQEEQRMRQLLKLIEAKRKEIQKEGKLVALVSGEIDEKEGKIKALKEKTNEIQVSIARILPVLSGLTNETSKLQAQRQKLKQKLSKLSSQTSQLTTKITQSTALLQQTNQTSTVITQQISTLIQQSNELNQKLIKTRQHVIQLNTLKNNQKKVNQLLKLKIRDLMKMVIDHQQPNN